MEQRLPRPETEDTEATDADEFTPRPAGSARRMLGSPLGQRVPLRQGSPLGQRVPLRQGSPLPPRPTGTRAPSRTPTAAYRGLPLLVRVVLWAIATIAVGGVLGATAPDVLRRLGAVAALQPGLLAWYSARIMGFTAYLVVAGSVLYGLLLSTKLLDAIAHRPVSFALHKDLAIAGVVLGMIHSIVLLADQSFAFTPRAILVPFMSPYATVPVGVGQLAFYGLLVVTASFYVRRQIGQRAWRILHYLTFAVFLGTTAHGIAAGSDSGTPWAFWIYLVPSAAATFLLVYRIAISVAAHRSPVLEGAPDRARVSPLISRAPQTANRGVHDQFVASIDSPVADLPTG